MDSKCSCVAMRLAQIIQYVFSRPRLSVRQRSASLDETDAAMPPHVATVFSLRWSGWRGSAISWLARGVQILVMLAASIVGIGFGMAAFSDSAGALAGGLLLWSALYYPAMIVHELGHYFGARRAGMAVLRMQLGAIEIVPQRKGFRWCWSPLKKQWRIGGYVLAFADPGLPKRKQIIALVVGGPGANLAVAAVLALAGWLSPPQGAGWAWMVFAAMNACLGLANLVPRLGKGGFPSDGLTLLRALRHRIDNSSYTRLVSLSVFGCTADRLPDDDIAALEAQALPMPLVALWYRMKADQNKGDWQAAAGKQAALEALLLSMDRAQTTQLADLIACIRTEIAFSQAIVTRDATVLADDLLPPKTAWHAPSLWPRCLALRAALAGDVERCVASLALSKRYAENAVDRALPISEQMIRAFMAEALGHAWNERAIDASRTA
ncbi:Peptidase family M50 [Dyella sp. OK004]|uniref:site-2 protease family protein n=1 Tax=Dyella sp. OK004 TaxID=1855292 RepID=UPI0008F419CC|nr:site-2 protease family protein [Dyella sp. OK004]SFS18853.1 Peptidase family M50 [Dyella sp. OK004]